MSHKRGQSGFSMTELILVMALFVPVLYGIVSAPRFISGSVQSNRSEAAVGLKCRMHAERVASMLRSACVGTLQIPTGGVWGPMADDTWYTGIRFQAIRGLQTASSTPLAAASTLEFALAPGEVTYGTNGKDDDRDGVVDNGFVRLTSGTGAVSRLTGRVERFRVRKSGRTVCVELGVAERDDTKRLHRRSCMVDVLLENN